MSKNKNSKTKNCEVCEIFIDVPKNYIIVQMCPLVKICPLVNNRLLIILSNGENRFSYIANYIPSNKYIIRRKEGLNTLLETDNEFYGC